MNTIFMSSENNKTSDPLSLLLNPSDKIDLKNEKYVIQKQKAEKISSNVE